jgi:hypothetical protein
MDRNEVFASLPVNFRADSGHASRSRNFYYDRVESVLAVLPQTCSIRTQAGAVFHVDRCGESDEPAVHAVLVIWAMIHPTAEVIVLAGRMERAASRRSIAEGCMPLREWLSAFGPSPAFHVFG